jgi:endonuclease/exonuclease/phosphatase family metal-dependent hydrolase
MKIATWNLRRPKASGWKYNPTIIKTLEEINADIWILTETQATIQPVACPHLATTTYYANEESYATIWSRYPIVYTHATCDPRLSVCVELETPLGHCLVYGTIITYAHEGTQSGAKLWENHYAAIAAQSQDWQKLAQTGLPLIVAGDFNETLHGKHSYGTQRGRTQLLEALQDCQLKPVTADNSIGHAIDHICLSQHWLDQLQPLTKNNQFQRHTNDKKPVSDHDGLWIDLQTY